MLPRLLMPNSFCLPPVEYCRGTTPTQAAKSRPRRKAAPLPIAATVAVETSGPKPGIWRRRWQLAPFITNALNLVRNGLDVDLDLLPLLPVEPAASVDVGSGSARHLQSQPAGFCAGE